MKRFSSESDSGDCSDEKQSKVEVIRSPVSDVVAHDKKFPFFRRPRVIGAFSVDSDRKFLANRSQMMFFCPDRLRNSTQAGSSYKRYTNFGHVCSTFKSDTNSCTLKVHHLVV